MSFIYNRLVVAPGVSLYLGNEGGDLLLAPPGAASSSMTLSMLKAKTWHLLREDGPDNGYPEPGINSDFPASVVTRDLNLALGQFISDSGLAPAITDRVDTFPVFALLDYPVPPSMLSITKIEYNPAGGFTYSLIGKSFQEFDSYTGFQVPPQLGQPRYYRQPFAGYLRLQPQPGPGQATGTGPGVGTYFVDGQPTAGDTATLTLTEGATIVTVSYTAIPGDTAFTVAAALSSLLNQSPAVSGGSAFVQPAIASGNEIPLNATDQGAVFYSAAVVTTANPPTMAVDPTTATQMTPVGDTMTFYYSSAGNVLINPGDTPGIPVVFHPALVYRVLADYWDRKNDEKQSEKYMNKYLGAVARAKAFTFDENRSTQPTTAGGDAEDYAGGYSPGYW